MNRNIIPYFLLILFIGSSLSSCRHRHHSYDDDAEIEGTSRIDERRTNREEYREERNIRRGTKVHMESEGGVYLVPINVNGLDLKFIFDTGASSICISSAEAAVMVRQGKITEEDVLGQQQFQDATGGVSVGTIVLLRTVQIGDITLENVEASIVDNIQAPLLLGQTALAKFGKVTIDYNHNTIEFN